MQLIFNDADVQKIVENPKMIQRKIGLELARMLKKRLNILEATDNFNEYLLKIGLGKPHPLTNNLDNCYGIFISKNYRLVVEPITEKLDMESLKECKVLNIKGVLDYHDGKEEWIIP